MPQLIRIGGLIGGGGGNPNVLAAYQGIVATNGRAPQLRISNGTTGQAITRSRHIATENLTAVKLVYAGWATIAGVETGSGANITINASIEYPVGSIASPGTRTRVLFGGSANGVVASSNNILSDACAVVIPKGAEFFVWSFHTAASFLCYNNMVNTVTNEGTQKAASGLTDVTMSGTITPNDNAMWVGPVAVVGQTTRRSVIAVGDSRCANGSGEAPDATGDYGEVCRSLGAMGVGYSNFGSASGNASDYITAHFRQVAIFQYCSDVITQYGQNDFNAGASLATMQSRNATMAGYVTGAGKRPHCVTIAPQTTGAWTLADGSDQTTHSSFAAREAYNDWLRAGGSGLIVHDIASVVEVTDTGKWKADGTPQKWTVDGVHQSQFAMQQIAAAGAISRAYFVS